MVAPGLSQRMGGGQRMTIEQLQHLLSYLGYDTGGVGNGYGPKTTQAVRDFQREFGGLEEDGKAGSETKKALRKAVGDGWIRPEKAEAVPNSGTAGTFWDEIEYFTREEFKCRCGQYHAPYCDGFPVEPDETLVRTANQIRGNLGRKAIPTSGIRCQKHNADQPNAAENSKHLYGKALDFYVEGYTGGQLLAEVKRHPKVNYAYIVSGNVVHMDVN